MTRQARIVVFTGDLAYSVRRGIAEIDRAVPGLSWLIVVHSPRKRLGKLLSNQWRNLRRNGWRWIPYQAGEICRRVLAGRAAALAPGSPGSEFTVAAVTRRPNTRVIAVADLYSPDSEAAVKGFQPDLGLSLAAPILRRPLFSIPRLGTVNLHKGKLPDYRGMPPAFWELWNDEASVGCTVHSVDDNLDTGAIIKQATVERAKFSTVRGLQLRLDEVGVELMRAAVVELLEGTATAQPQAPRGKTYRKPTLAQAAILKRRLARIQRTRSSMAKRALRRTRSSLAFRSWQMGLGRVLRPRITVLLYHRVSDDVRDNLTVGVEQFDRQIALVRKHCEPLSIGQVLAHETIPRSKAPLVAITFDDGYLDNYVNAAPILLRHGVPAAFFVSTGIVDTEGRFPHDVRRGNPPIAVMSWGQLHKMKDWGFTIGSHSVSHIDCAAEPESRVRAELLESRDTLRRELGITDSLFAYPYGGRQHMTPQRLELVKQAGYSACLSAYGGTNIGAVDPYNVLRRGIHWEFSDSSFLYECLGF